MYSRRCLATTLTTVLVIGVLVLLIANSVNLLVFDIIGAQENSLIPTLGIRQVLDLSCGQPKAKVMH